MAAIAFLVIGVVCSLISRILLVKAAFGVNWKWGVGVFVPFGPTAFRLNYPEEAQSSRIFRLATLPCFFFYLMMSPGLLPAATKLHGTKPKQPATSESFVTTVLRDLHLTPAPTPEPTPTIAMRQTANDREIERLKVWSEVLRMRKRDILHSDVAGARAYDRDAADYNVALDKANAERLTLASLKK